MGSSLTEEKIQENEKLVRALVQKMSPSLVEDLNEMLDALPEFFLAPASSRMEFHGCYVGGLVDHSLRVATNLQTIAKALAPGVYDPKELVFLGLFHDLGKVGDVGVPMYVPNPSEWHRNKLGQLFEVNKDLPYMPICDRTMYLLQKFNITLTNEEYIAIRISDGPYEKANEKYAMKEPDLAVLLHFADRWACAQEKRLV
jgi:hypothetical protein